MKKNAFKAIFCYLLCLAVIAVYACVHDYRPEFDFYDFAPTFDFSYGMPYVSINAESMGSGWFAANAEGQKLRFIMNVDSFRRLYDLYVDQKWDYEFYLQLKDKLYEGLYGDMKGCLEFSIGMAPSVIVPWSESITTQTRPMPREKLFPGYGEDMTAAERQEWNERWQKEQDKYLAPSHSSAFFHFEDGERMVREYVDGFSGAIIFHSDGTVELYGDTTEIKVRIMKTRSQWIDDWRCTNGREWTVTGSGGLYAKISVVDGEIEAEGLTCYEVKQESVENPE